MLASLVSIGIDLRSARLMGFSEAAWILTARAETSGDGGSSNGVREATQADIRKLLCG